MITRFPTLRLEGGLISSDQIDRVADQKVKELSIDDIAAAWSDIRSYWMLFEKSIAKLSEDNLATSETRNRWMIPFFSTLGYELTARNAAEVDGQTYAISHRAGKEEDSPPIHIVGIRQSLDRRPESGRPRLAPHSLVQEYLNRTEHLWGIVTNGSTLRILRDSHLLRKQAYIEFDLEQMMKDEQFADFALLFRLIHASRLPKGIDDADSCLLEQYHRQTIEQGGRVRDHLRDGVEKALIRFANGFLTHARNTALRAKVQDKTLEPFEYYQQILRLIYRFLFLAVSEERNLITDNLPYRQFYSISRIRRLAEVRAAYTDQEDLWLGLATSFKLFQDESLGPILSVPILNGDLFDPVRTSEINGASLSNRDLLTAIWDICMYREKENTPWRRINYAALDVEELGSVYESLLDFQPIFLSQNGIPMFTLLAGTERKSTGSYYTPPELVNELIQSALIPVIKDRLALLKTPAEKEGALLTLSVCDPACGSGHFLLAASRTIGRELAKARTGDEEPAPEQMRIAIRDTITHCIYGVDKNPLAVDLCKVALWLEGHTKAKPLTFLDHRVRCGDSLVGVFDLSVLKEGIPDDAFTAVTGDDKMVARELKKQNKHEREHRRFIEFEVSMKILTASRQQVNAIADDKPEDIRKKKELFFAFQEEGTPWCKDKTACDLWIAAFFVGLTKEHVQNRHVPTTETVREYIAKGAGADLPQVKIARQLASKYRFFHWPLEFPEVFVKGGFDCVLGNPPWERIKLQQQEFFATRDFGIANAPNKAARERLIKGLSTTNPALLLEYDLALYGTDATSRFIRLSKRFPFTGTGDINTYAVFSEHVYAFIAPNGRAGIIVPTGIATDATTAPFFASLIESKRLTSLYDFENKNQIFPIHRSFKFCLLTMNGEGIRISTFDFAFFLHESNEIKDQERHFSLTSDEIRLINPNTRNCPIFRTRRDAAITKAIYRRVPVLINESKGESGNPWEIAFIRMFDVSNDSHLFRTRVQMETEGFQLDGNWFVKGNERWLPVYEAKMFHIYNHRFGTFSDSEINNPSIRQSETKEYLIPKYSALPYYWVNEQEVKRRIDKKLCSLIAYRKIARSTDARTAISTILPLVGVTYSAVVFDSAKGIQSNLLLIGNFNSIVFDYITRMKLGGTNLAGFIVKQLAIIPPDDYPKVFSSIVLPKIIELTYTAWDLEPFAQEILKEIGANTWNRWFPNNPLVNGRPQPFIWNEEWRAILRADLDACYARLYGLNREELEYILGTFPVLQKNEEGKFGEYRTRKLVLKAWDTIETVEKSIEP